MKTIFSASAAVIYGRPLATVPKLEGILMPHFYELLRDGSCVLTFSEHDEASQAFARYSRLYATQCWELIEKRQASLAKYNPPKSKLPSTLPVAKPQLE